jgi:GNAT superfamily N-acetyltransferase
MHFSVEKIEGAIDQEMSQFAKECIDDALLKYMGFQIDPLTFVTTLETYAKDHDKVFFIARANGKVIGVFFGEAKNIPFTNHLMAVELYFRVSEEYRGQGVGKCLIMGFEAWAKGKGCEISVCGVNQFTSSATKDANRRLARDGYRLYVNEYFKVL